MLSVIQDIAFGCNFANVENKNDNTTLHHPNEYTPTPPLPAAYSNTRPPSADAPEFIRVWLGWGFGIIVSIVEPDRGVDSTNKARREELR